MGAKIFGGISSTDKKYRFPFGSILAIENDFIETDSGLEIRPFNRSPSRRRILCA